MRHRHLDYPADAVPESLGLAAIDDVLDRGDLGDWAPLARVVARDPEGSVAEAILRLCESHPMYGTSPLWRTWIERLRAGEPISAHRNRVSLAELRRRRGLTQAVLAERLSMTQSDVSKLERRADLRLSTLRAYVEGTGARLRLSAAFLDGETVDVDLPGPQPDTGNARWR